MSMCNCWSVVDFRWFLKFFTIKYYVFSCDCHGVERFCRCFLGRDLCLIYLHKHVNLQAHAEAICFFMFLACHGFMKCIISMFGEDTDQLQHTTAYYSYTKDGVDPFINAEEILAEASQRIRPHAPRARLDVGRVTRDPQQLNSSCLSEFCW